MKNRSNKIRSNEIRIKQEPFLFGENPGKTFDGTQKFDAKRSANVFGFILLGDVSDNFWAIF